MMVKNKEKKNNRALFMESVHGDVCWRRIDMKHTVMTIVDSGQQMSAVGQQAVWSADHVIISDGKSDITVQ